MYLSTDNFIKNYYKFPIYLIFGEEEFLIEESLNSIINSINLRNDNFDLDILDGENSTLNEILQIAQNYPFASTQRTLIVKKFDKLIPSKISKKNDEFNKFLEYLNNPAIFTNLILVANIDKLKDLKKNLQNNQLNEIGLNKLKDLKIPFDKIIKDYYWNEFPKLYESEYPNWIIERFKKEGKNISNDAVQYLAIQCGNSLRELSQEIEKLCIYKIDNSDILLNDVLNVTGSNKEYNVFELQKAIAERNLNKSILILNKLLDSDSQEMLIISVISKFMINAWKFMDLKNIISDENVLAKEMNMQKWQLKDYLLISNNYKVEEIEQAIIKITDTDFKLKSGISNKLALLQNLFFEILIKN